MTDRLFISAPFSGLVADMPAASAPLEQRVAWLERTRARLLAASAGPHGVTALRLAGAINHERHELMEVA